MADLRKAGGRTVAVGVVLIALGVLSLAAPLVTGIAVALLVGAALLIAGVAMAADAWRGRAFGTGVGDFLWALLFAFAGLLVLLHPLMGLAFLTLLLASLFFVAGVWKSMAAWRFRPRPGWGLLLTSGIVSLVLGVMIVASWPVSGTWAVGTLVGVELLFDGWSLVSLGAAMREAGRAPV
jgi:uncharacterized membrane protein HdeD (DUF308 family)